MGAVPSHYCGQGYNSCQGTPWVEVVHNKAQHKNGQPQFFFEFHSCKLFSKIKVESECGLYCYNEDFMVDHIQCKGIK